VQIEYLVSFPQYQVCVVDNRGSGRTVTPTGRITYVYLFLNYVSQSLNINSILTPRSHSTSWMAQDVEQLVNHLGWDKVHLVGNSLGMNSVHVECDKARK
jgi:pimeloyl-ACP methyl ester carboxylesterase